MKSMPEYRFSMGLVFCVHFFVCVFDVQQKQNSWLQLKPYIKLRSILTDFIAATKTINQVKKHSDRLGTEARTQHRDVC